MIPVLIRTIEIFFGVFYILLFARIILSWIPIGQGSRLVELIFALTEPILAPIRSLVQRSPLGGPGMIIDFSPIIAFLLIQLVSTFLTSFLRTLA
ncbi:MAG: YggT family protein [Defluviitaleaceae bacterium]|nr:YggT family protein [Defluviitaleaceae bacterium]